MIILIMTFTLKSLSKMLKWYSLVRDNIYFFSFHPIIPSNANDLRITPFCTNCVFSNLLTCQRIFTKIIHNYKSLLVQYECSNSPYLKLFNIFDALCIGRNIICFRCYLNGIDWNDRNDRLNPCWSIIIII